MYQNGPWLGQVPVKGSSGTPPYYGQWALNGGTSGTVGPFDTSEKAFLEAVKAVREAGAKALPADGYARVVDSKGEAVGPVT